MLGEGLGKQELIGREAGTHDCGCGVGEVPFVAPTISKLGQVRAACSIDGGRAALSI